MIKLTLASPQCRLMTTILPSAEGYIVSGFGEAVVACDMPEPCKFPSLDSCRMKFMETHKEVDLVPHPVVGLVFKVGDTEKLPQALGSESLDRFLQSASRVHVSQPYRMDVTRDL